MAIDEGSKTAGSGLSAEDNTGWDRMNLWRITRAAGFVTATLAGLGLIGLATGITVFTSVLPEYKSIAISAALIWLFLGLVLASHAVRPLTGRPALAVRTVLAGIAILEAIELAFSLMGSHSVVETFLFQIWSTLFGHPTTLISPVASALIILASLALFSLLAPAGMRKQDQRIQDAAGFTGLAIALVAFTFVLSYWYGAPFMYNTALIPIALTSALSGFFTGTAIVAAAGPRAIPLKYLSGSSTRGRLLRVFIPLVILLTLAQNLVFAIITDLFRMQNALLLSVCIVVFVFVTAGVITRFSDRIGRDLDDAEEALVHKNEDLAAINEELTAMTEELRANNDELLINERALHESLQRNTFLSDILDSASQPFGVGYPDGRLGIVNPAFEELTGYTADELQRIDWAATLTPPEWLDVERKSLEELHRTGKPVRYEKEYIKKDGTRVAIELLVHLVADKDGNPQYYYSFITDITERKQAEEVLKTLADNLKASNQELERFAYVASHDLKEPLRMVTSFSQILKKRYKGQLDADADEFLGYIVDGALRMEALISDLLRYSHINQSMRSIEQIDMKDAIEDATTNLLMPICEHNARITQGAMPSIQGDLSQMVQLFQNLIGNAIKYCSEEREPEIWINAERTGKDWTFSVKDNGIGIDPAYHEQIFMIFRRLHTRTEYPGTGIGLAVVKRIVERHGGRIWVESEEGKGSTFFFTIPEKPL